MPPSCLSRVSLVTAAVALLACNIGCTTTPAGKKPRVKADGTPEDVALDEDAPAAESWVAMHARGTHVVIAPAAADDPASGMALGRLRERPALASGEIVTFVSGELALPALVVRPPSTALTGSTPTEKLPGLVVVPPVDVKAAALDALSLDALDPAACGCVIIVPSYRGQTGNPGKREAGFHEVDDVKAAARFLASEPDVDVDHLFAFGDGLVALQLSLDPDAPFKAVGAVGVTSSASLKADATLAAAGAADAPFERMARAFLPHAHEVSANVKLVIFAAGAAGAEVHARNARVELREAAKDPLADFFKVMSALAPQPVAWGPAQAAPPSASSRSAP